MNLVVKRIKWKGSIEDVMMVVRGCDIGSTTGKAVVMIDGVISGESVVTSTTDPGLTERLATEDALNRYPRL